MSEEEERQGVKPGGESIPYPSVKGTSAVVTKTYSARAWAGPKTILRHIGAEAEGQLAQDLKAREDEVRAASEGERYRNFELEGYSLGTELQTKRGATLTGEFGALIDGTAAHQMKSLRMRNRPYSKQTGHIDIEFDGKALWPYKDGIKLTVEGPNRSWVEGAYAVLVEPLEAKLPWWAHKPVAPVVTGLSTSLLWVILYLAVNQMAGGDVSTTTILIRALGLLVGAILLWVFIGKDALRTRLLLQFEPLEEGKETRLKRALKPGLPILTLLLTLALGLPPYLEAYSRRLSGLGLPTA